MRKRQKRPLKILFEALKPTKERFCSSLQQLRVFQTALVGTLSQDTTRQQHHATLPATRCRQSSCPAPTTIAIHQHMMFLFLSYFFHKLGKSRNKSGMVETCCQGLGCLTSSITSLDIHHINFVTTHLPQQELVRFEAFPVVILINTWDDSLF